MSCLICITGESYRNGKQMSRSRGIDENTTNKQLRAIKSHLKLIDKIKDSFNINTDILLNLYTLDNERDNLIIQTYKENINVNNIYSNFKSKLIGCYNLLIDTCNLTKDLSKYKFVIFIRIDLFLKDYFIEIFTIEDKIKFAHINEIGIKQTTFNIGMDGWGSSGYVENNILIKPSVNFEITYIPNKFFYLIENKQIFYKDEHDSYIHLLNYISKTDMELYIYTSHSSSTDIMWNPLFHQVGRKECKKWYCKDLFINPDTLEITYVKDSDIYNNLVNNDFDNNDCKCIKYCRDMP